MPASHSIWAVFLAASVSACSFDSSRLADRACSPGGCSSDQVCCEGYCVLAGSCVDAAIAADTSTPDLGPDFDERVDRDLDGVRDSEDNCPDTRNPRQGDADKDGRGDLCDCAPTDSAFGRTLVDISAFEDPPAFAAIEHIGNWQVLDRYLQQAATDGVQRAEHHNIGSYSNLLAIVGLQLTGSGDDGLDDPAEGISFAGVGVRTKDLAPGKGAGYFCGLDQKNQRLLVARTEGDDLGNKKLTLLGEDYEQPGVLINKPIRQDHTYSLTLRVVGDLIGCRVLLTDYNQVETTTRDDRLHSGGVAIFTAGASALVESVKVCAKN